MLKNDKHNIPQLLVSLNHKIQKKQKIPLTPNHAVLRVSLTNQLLNRTSKAWHEV